MYNLLETCVQTWDGEVNACQDEKEGKRWIGCSGRFKWNLIGLKSKRRNEIRNKLQTVDSAGQLAPHGFKHCQHKSSPKHDSKDLFMVESHEPVRRKKKEDSNTGHKAEHIGHVEHTHHH